MKVLRWAGLLSLLWLGVSCVDSEKINARFASSSASWYRYDATGLQKVPSPAEPWYGNWKPYDQAERTTDLIGEQQEVFAAVSGLGLVEVSDAEGIPKVQVIASGVPLAGVRTGRLFPFDAKVFLTLYREPRAEASAPSGPPLTLAWYQTGTSSLSFYPVPFQLQNPQRQAVFSRWDSASGTLAFVWKSWEKDRWVWETSRLALASGQETDTARGWQAPPTPPPLPTEWKPLWFRLAERNGGGLASRAVVREPDQGQAVYSWSPVNDVAAERVSGVEVCGALLSEGKGRVAVASNGYIAFQRKTGGDVRLYKLFDLGAAGRYTAVVPARHGIVLAWDTYWRSYTGSAGLVYIPEERFAP
jgi:hypothetical protein